MPRQTATKNYQFPDGFQLAVDVGDGSEDIGLIAGGANGTLNYDIEQIDGGNYLDVINRAKNFTFQLSPSAVWNFEVRTFQKMLAGIASISAGDLVNYAGSNAPLTDIKLRMTQFSDEDAHTLIEADITALTTDTTNDYITVAKTVFTTSLDWTTDIDSLLKINGMHEVHASDKNTVDAQGNYYTDATNLYFIVATGTYLDLAAAKTGLAGTTVTAFNDINWQFTLYNANVDPGANWNFKGLNEDGLDEFNATFTGRPEPAEGYRMMKVFIAD